MNAEIPLSDFNQACEKLAVSLTPELQGLTDNNDLCTSLRGITMLNKKSKNAIKTLDDVKKVARLKLAAERKAKKDAKEREKQVRKIEIFQKNYLKKLTQHITQHITLRRPKKTPTSRPEKMPRPSSQSKPQ